MPHSPQARHWAADFREVLGVLRIWLGETSSFRIVLFDTIGSKYPCRGKILFSRPQLSPTGIW